MSLAQLSLKNVESFLFIKYFKKIFFVKQPWNEVIIHMEDCHTPDKAMKGSGSCHVSEYFVCDILRSRRVNVTSSCVCKDHCWVPEHSPICQRLDDFKEMFHFYWYVINLREK